MNPDQDFNQLYKDVSDSVATAMKEIADLKVEHKDGKKVLSNMMERLSCIQVRFDGELSLLEEHTEWDKFTMAFFGETNAGKSTIIESLRIIFNEDSRQRLLEHNARDVTQFEKALTGHMSQVRAGLNSIYSEYANEIFGIKQNAAALARVLQDESSARIKRKLWLFAIGGIFLGASVVGTITMLA